MEKNDTGILINPTNIKIHRDYFKQMCKLLGINVLFRAPRPGSKTYNGYGELDTFYEQASLVSCIFDEHTPQKTMRKLGWNTELSDSSTVIHVPYDLKGLQAGALFIIPSGLDNTEGRVFKVLRMSNIAVYPASISCELGPVLVNTSQKEETHDFTKSNFNLLDDDSDEFE